MPCGIIALAAATVWAYYAFPSVAAALEPLRKWQAEGGWWAAFLNRVFFNGLLPGVFLLAIPSIRPRHVLLVIAAQALWGGCWGVATDFFFRCAFRSACGRKIQKFRNGVAVTRDMWYNVGHETQKPILDAWLCWA